MSWTRVPFEIWQEIIEYGTIRTCTQLRLTCKQLSQLCLGPTFVRAVRNQKIQLTEESLDSLEGLASHPMLGPVVKGLTIIVRAHDLERLHRARGNKTSKVAPSVADDSEDEAFWDRQDIHWTAHIGDKEIETVPNHLVVDKLEAIFRNLKHLDYVRMWAEFHHVHPFQWYEIRPNRMPWIRKRTSRAYYLTMLAIVRSNVFITSLEIFSAPPFTIDYAISPRALIAPFQHVLDQEVTASFENLQLCVYDSNCANPDNPDINLELTTARGYTVSEARALLSFLRSISQIRSLSLSLGCYLVHLTWPRTFDGAIDTERITSYINVPLLVRCKLHNMQVYASILVVFLKKALQLKELELENLKMREGTWTGVFAFIEQQMPGLERLKLDHLQSHSCHTISVRPVWDHQTGYKAVARREFDADGIKRGLRFEPLFYSYNL
ncbi:hypothetical protein BDV25DRAFT_140745 [Aspergillus avenaceus]|uniref:Uncharacterized protein n=1 Tax=Aspergillus avenaceus TaxID=36643 RepID=A0A5N6TT00_ASPAV|nr:hypothetical protein BDV25DRAFT_140745 [Aspergillus avenaceus]